MSNRSRSRIPNPSGSLSKVRPSPDSNGGGSLSRDVSSPNSTGPRHSHSTPTPSSKRVRTGLVETDTPAPKRTNLADVFHSVTPNGIGIIGGRGEEFADDYYSKEDDDREESPPIPSTPVGSNAGDFIGSQKPTLTRLGDRFGDHAAHSRIVKLFWEGMTEPWYSIKRVPQAAIKQMFHRLREHYNWDLSQEQRNLEGFENTLKIRFRDRMGDVRKASAKLAMKAGVVLPMTTDKDGNPIPDINKSFHLLHNHVPYNLMHPGVWADLCRYWDSEAWKKLSASGKNNRNTADSQGGTARHTGGSIGFDEHRARLRKLLGREPDWIDVFLQTHLIAASKAKYFAGDADGLRFCNETAEAAYEAFKKSLIEKHGENLTPELTNDPDLWADSQLRRQGGKTKGRIYGIGTSDLQYVVTGTYSSGSGSSSAAALQAQQEVKSLREEMAAMAKELGERQAQQDIDNEKRELELKETKLQQSQLQATVAFLMSKMGCQPPSLGS